jgi:hypothetical protein
MSDGRSRGTEPMDERSLATIDDSEGGPHEIPDSGLCMGTDGTLADRVLRLNDGHVEWRHG